MDSNWDLKAVVLIQVSYDQYRATRASELQSYTELQSFESKTEVQKRSKHRKTPKNTVKHRTFRDLVMGNRSKDENAAASNNTRDRDQESNSRDQDTRDTSLAKAIAEAVAQQTQTIAEVFQRQIQAVSRQKSEETQALTDVFQRQMEETRAQYQELLKASCAQKLSSTLKVTSGTNGFRVMDAFDWTNDKNIYQRWQLWSHKARLALDAMEGDNDCPTEQRKRQQIEKQQWKGKGTE